MSIKFKIDEKNSTIIKFYLFLYFLELCFFIAIS